MASLRRSTIVSILFTLFGGPGWILLYLPFLVTRFHIPAVLPNWQRTLGWALIVLGLIPLFESILRFIRVGRGTLMPQVPTEKLVISGLYRWVRNPMYVGDLTALAGEALLFSSRAMVAYAVFVWLVLNWFISRYEEPTLRKRHGAAYARYCEAVHRWIPRVPQCG